MIWSEWALGGEDWVVRDREEVWLACRWRCLMDLEDTWMSVLEEDVWARDIGMEGGWKWAASYVIDPRCFRQCSVSLNRALNEHVHFRSNV